MTIKTTITGFPRIGENRELKHALENYWAGRTTLEDLSNTSKAIRLKHWKIQQDNGIDLISCNDFSWYDNMLDTIVMLDAVPDRFRQITDPAQQYFAMARGTKECQAMEMTKWFNTNYHYIVPELTDDMEFSLNISKIKAEYQEALSTGITPKINIIGPLTFMGLSKHTEGKDPYTLFEKIYPVYKELVDELILLNDTVYIQFDEPVFVKDPSPRQLELLEKTYTGLAGTSSTIKIIVTTYFEHSREATAILAATPVWGIGLDLVHGPANIESIPNLGDKKLIAGIVNGRNIWVNDIQESLATLEQAAESIPVDNIIVSTSCSLLHVPYSIQNEHGLAIDKQWFSFALEKLNEADLVSKLLHNQEISGHDAERFQNNKTVIREKAASQKIHNDRVKNRVNNIQTWERQEPFQTRIAKQKAVLGYPEMATTTIGSFPQTPELRKLRKEYKNKTITSEQYEKGITQYIDESITFQEKIGLDILVHGEPERNDMVEYFGELLNGFAFTSNGWVQSYGSRCVKPPVIYGDIERPLPMTVKWAAYAQSKTAKNVKGMLTGPVTILNWSFVRDDIERSQVAQQIALALSDEITDLQDAGIKIIQVDEAAFKEGYPLRKNRIPEYETWAVKNFKLAVSTAKPETQIHTHMCYSDFNDIIKVIESMDADVITIETARSGNELLNIFAKSGYTNEIGPGVYDIHSPRVPSVAEFTEQIQALLGVVPKEQLWINPDCGLKTRKWEEAGPALKNMVTAVHNIRSGY